VVWGADSLKIKIKIKKLKSNLMASSPSQPSVWKSDSRPTTPREKWEFLANFWESFFQPPKKSSKV
jgi:hypothetical protein